MLEKLGTKKRDPLQVGTKTVTSAILNAAGDVISQKYFEGNDKLDWKRTGIFAFLVSNCMSATDFSED